MDTSTFDATFWITMTGLVLSFLGGTGIYFLKSKCVRCSLCWGLIHVERDADAENDEEKMEIENGVNYDPSNAVKH
jgi:hypothetical protein